MPFPPIATHRLLKMLIKLPCYQTKLVQKYRFASFSIPECSSLKSYNWLFTGVSYWSHWGWQWMCNRTFARAYWSVISPIWDDARNLRTNIMWFLPTTTVTSTCLWYVCFLVTNVCFDLKYVCLKRTLITLNSNVLWQYSISNWKINMHLVFAQFLLLNLGNLWMRWELGMYDVMIMILPRGNGIWIIILSLLLYIKKVCTVHT